VGEGRDVEYSDRCMSGAVVRRKRLEWVATKSREPRGVDREYDGLVMGLVVAKRCEGRLDELGIAVSAV
jgi:hypothetical protein